eukprot:364760-Chlamydomonas_euryale.AAC.11
MACVNTFTRTCVHAASLSEQPHGASLFEQLRQTALLIGYIAPPSPCVTHLSIFALLISQGSKISDALNPPPLCHALVHLRPAHQPRLKDTRRRDVLELWDPRPDVVAVWVIILHTDVFFKASWGVDKSRALLWGLASHSKSGPKYLRVAYLHQPTP